MVQKEGEKLLSADIDCKTVDKFLSQASQRGFTKKRVLAAAVKLWTELPLEAQARLLSKDTDVYSFAELICQVIREQMNNPNASWGRKKPS
jgi:hypothetical protein